MKARVVYSSDRDLDGMEIIAVNGHRIQYGGADGDGYCYEHQSFDCAENLTDEERVAVQEAW